MTILKCRIVYIWRVANSQYTILPSHLKLLSILWIIVLWIIINGETTLINLKIMVLWPQDLPFRVHDPQIGQKIRKLIVYEDIQFFLFLPWNNWVFWVYWGYSNSFIPWNYVVFWVYWVYSLLPSTPKIIDYLSL